MPLEHSPAGGPLDPKSLHPSGKLSSVTRKGNEIKSLLSSANPTRKLVKSELRLYKERVFNFEVTCKEFNKTDVTPNKEMVKFNQWYDEHLNKMLLFQHEVNNWLQANKAEGSDASTVTSYKSSRVSATNSLKQRAAEERAKQQALEAVQSEAYELEKAKVNAKTRELQDNLELAEAERALELKKQSALVKALEDEVKNEDEDFQFPREKKLDFDFTRPVNLSERLRSLDNFGPVRHPYFDDFDNQFPNPIDHPSGAGNFEGEQANVVAMLLKLQQQAQLPKCEPNHFDGLDLTTFYEFMHCFKVMIADKCNNDVDRFAYLQKYTSGLPLQLVNGCRSRSNPSLGYSNAIALLNKEFGNEFKIANCYIKKLNEWETFKLEDAEALQQFSLFLMSVDSQMKEMSTLNQLNSHSEMYKVVMKLPYKLREGWRNVVFSMQERVRNPVFADLVDYVRCQSRKYNLPLYGDIADKPIERSSSFFKEKREQLKKRSLNTAVISSDLLCIYCDKTSHNLQKCFAFEKKSYEDKIKFAKENELCFRCLGRSHLSNACRVNVKCATCSKRHITVLHREDKVKPENEKPEFLKEASSGVEESINEEVHCSKTAIAMVGSLNGDGNPRVICAAVPVKVQLAGCSSSFVLTYMGLDSHCTDVFMSKSLKEKLGAKGVSSNIPLTTMHHKNSMTKTQVLNNLEIYDLDENEFDLIPVIYCQDPWPFDARDSPKPEDIDNYPCFSNIPFGFLKGIEIGLLVGANQPHLVKPRGVIDGPSDRDPYVTLHKFGYALNGPLNTGQREKLLCNRIKIDESSDINDVFHEFCSLEFKDDGERACPSIEDQRWEEKVKNSMKVMEDGHYEVELPFRSPQTILPSNYAQVKGRLLSLKRKLALNRDLLQEYQGFMDLMFKSGFAERVPSNELHGNEGRTWYLVHFAVRHKRKGKIRIVFDASLRYKGVCLNDVLLSGPDLTSSLLGVLLRFRQEKLAFMGDICKMFYQVRVPNCQRDYLRFFWYPNNNINSEPVEYRVTVHIFGAVSSPSVANYVLRSTAHSQLASSVSNEARDSILRSFYVDDLLKSTTDDCRARILLEEIQTLVSSACFTLTGFVSNSRSLLHSLPVDDLAGNLKDLDLSFDKLPHERALGVSWNIDDDTLKFNIDLVDQPVTKRGVLATVFSVYDPLGLAGPAILAAKKIFQQTCYLRLGWDECLPSDLSVEWKKWIEDIYNLSKYSIPRCYKNKRAIEAMQLHIFCDGSKSAFSSVAYIRCLDSHDVPHCTLVMAKTHLVPLKSSAMVTIPRVELNAAKLAVKILLTLVSELEVKFSHTYLWSDSTTVLKYINNETRRFKRFVANRIAYIREHSDVKSWRHVPTGLNPADVASRGISAAKLLQCDQWINGPHFLWESIEAWPDSPMELKDCSILPDDPELVNQKTSVLSTKLTVLSPTDMLLESSSSWHCTRIRVCWMLRLRQFLLRRQTEQMSAPLSQIELEQAEKAIWCYVQRRAFPESLSALMKLSTTKENSVLRSVLKKEKLFKLQPIYSEGMLKVGGRIDQAVANDSIRHPILLPQNHHIVKIFVKGIHYRIGHLGRERLKAELRQGYWIVGGNALVKSTINDCILCKKLNGRPGNQLMSDLPEERLLSDKPAFSSIGLDAFGPYFVTRGRGRAKEKRYGIVFSCLVSRAIHLEVVYSLETSSFIDAFRRFCARRGNPQRILSDNGTNFVGAHRELLDSIANWNGKQTQEWLLQTGIEWKFNPPMASHFGGAYEREIRTIRKVITGLMNEQPVNLNDEGLSTLFCEVESVLNGRPLTPVSSDPNDLEALTPNHLLMSRQDASFPPGLFGKEDLYARRKWRQIQYLADLFWRRWRREYLPLLQERQKWTTPRSSFEVGDLVLLTDQQLPRNQWSMGRVIHTFKDTRGHVRTVDIKIKKVKGILKPGNASVIITRPIVKLILLKSNLYL